MATHEFFGQVEEADVANLVTDLAGKQPLDSDLTSIAGLSPSNDDVVQRKSGAWTNRTMAQVKTDLALAKGDVGLGNVDNTSDASKPVSTATQTALDGKQNLDSDLTTIAGLTATTDNFIQSKSSAWASRTPAQVAADLATPLASSFQPLDSDLTTIAGLTATTDSFLQSKSSAWTTRTIAQVRTDLREVKPFPPVTLTDGATPALDASLGTHFVLTAAGNRTIAVPTNPVDGQVIVIQHIASGSARTLALNTGTGGFAFGTDITALSATSSGLTDYIQCVYNSTANKWRVIAYVKGF